MLHRRKLRVGKVKCRKFAQDVPSHDTPVKHRPQASVESEAGSSDDGKGDVEDGTRSSIEYDEGRDDTVSQPHTDPCLPP